MSWAEFGRRYRAELCTTSKVDQSNRTIKNHGQKFTLRLVKHLAKQGTVTLLCHCAEEQEHCHRHALKKVIESARIWHVQDGFSIRKCRHQIKKGEGWRSRAGWEVEVPTR